GGFGPTLAGRLLWGIAWSGFWIAGNTAVLDVTTDANRGRLVGRLHMWTFAGYAGGALFGGLLADWVGYHATFAVFAGTALLAFLLWFLFLPETRPPAAAPSTAAEPAKAAPRSRLSSPALIPIATATAIMGLNWLIFLGVTGATLALLLQERIGEALALGLLVIPLTTLTGFVAAGKDTLSLLAAPLSGALSDYLGSRWLVILVALAAGLIALLLVAFGSGLLVIPGLLLGAIITGVLQAQVAALVGDHSGANRRGRLLGVVGTAGDVGAAA